jgi:glycosyltransferase involved in cell wall biosynthesis
MPVLEAQYFHATSILSDIDVFKEVSSGNAIFVQPNSVEQVSKLISQNLKKKQPLLTLQENVEEKFEWKISIKELRGT